MFVIFYPTLYLFQLFVTAGPVSFLAFCFVLVILASCFYVVFLKLGKDTERYKGTFYIVKFRNYIVTFSELLKKRAAACVVYIYFTII